MQLIFKDVDLPVVAQWLFPWSRPFGCSLCFSQLPYTWWLSRLCSCFKCHKCSSEYERCCTHAATSSSSSLCRMGPRPVHRPLCWERLRGILLRPGRGYASFGDECGNVLGDPNVSVRRIEASFRKRCNFPFGFASWRKGDPNVFCAEDPGFLSEAVQFPFGFASWRKGDPNVSVRRIETSFRKRCNSLSGLQIGEKAIQTCLCGGSRLPFGSGAIPFRVCKLAKRRSKRF